MDSRSVTTTRPSARRSTKWCSALLLAATFFAPAALRAADPTLDPAYYVSPLREVSGLFSANFAEMRPDHFHSGVDFKTDGTTGKPVVAVAEGYISRVAVTPGGYGRALYVAHPNGTTSVYAHLNSFRADVEAWVHEERYRTRRSSVNLFPAAGRFAVRQGEVIARSGNTGGSMGPHLHFEIRDSRTQRTLNPVTAGVVGPRDDLPPRIARLWYVALDSLAGVAVHAPARPIPVVEASAGRYHLQQEGPLEIGRRGYFILETIDRKNDVTNTFGVWRVRERVDSALVFELRLDAFAFDQTRYCNAVSCYSMQRGARNEFIRLTRLEGCIGDFYPEMTNRALLTPEPGQEQTVQIEACDDSGNRSVLNFATIGGAPEKDFHATADPRAAVAGRALTTFRHSDNGASIEIPSGALYEPVFWRQSMRPYTEETPPGVTVFSPIHTLLDRDTPLHRLATVSIKADVPPESQPHTALARVVGGKLAYAGGRYAGGAATAGTRTLGDFCVASDSEAPKLTPRFDPDKPISGGSVTWAWSDNFSGLGSYTATIDGAWIPLDRNPMRGTITHTFDETRTPRGASYELEIRASDNCGNRTVRRYTLRR